jgi:hypothetical protein
MTTASEGVGMEMNHPLANTYRELVYWFQHDPIQNCGDYLTDYLAAKLLIRTPRLPGDIRLGLGRR